MSLQQFNRRTFIHRLGASAFALPAVMFSSTSMAEPLQARRDTMALEEEEGWSQNQRPLGIALVGLGQYSEGQLAPALEKTRHCKLAGIVTGTPEKAERWKKKYNLPQQNIYNYKNFDSIKDNADIDIVYVVLPNSMHAEFTIRAAKAGKHVICEKPMAVSVKECEDMISACKSANRLLSIGYRLHFEPHNLAMSQYQKDQVFGVISKVYAKHGMDIEKGVWRLDKELAGGGPLMDVGIYCVQAAIYALNELPISVSAREGKKTDLERFKEVEQSLTWTMNFPSGAIAECQTSYAEEMNLLRSEGNKGWAQLQPAYAYSGIKGMSSDGKIKLISPATWAESTRHCCASKFIFDNHK